MSVFGTWLQGEIDARGWDQRMAAQRIGVPETNVHNWIHQDIKPGRRAILKIARALKLPLETVMEQAEYDEEGWDAELMPDEAAQQRAEVLARLPQFADIIDLVANKPLERQAAYLDMIRRLLIDPPGSAPESSQ